MERIQTNEDRQDGNSNWLGDDVPAFMEIQKKQPDSETEDEENDLPMLSWKEFQTLSDDDRIQYLDSLSGRYGLGIKDIGLIMNVHPTILRPEAKRLGFEAKKYKFNHEQAEEYRNWFHQKRAENSIKQAEREQKRVHISLSINCTPEEANKILDYISSTKAQSSDFDYSFIDSRTERPIY